MSTNAVNLIFARRRRQRAGLIGLLTFNEM
jgi:hypothetical protein